MGKIPTQPTPTPPVPVPTPPLPQNNMVPPQTNITPWLLWTSPQAASWVQHSPEDRGPDIGFSIQYDQQQLGLQASIFIYNRSQGTIVRSEPVLQQELRNTLAVIQQAVQMGTYQSAREIASSTTRLGGLPTGPLTVFHTLMIMRNNVERQSFTYITTHRGYFFKIRLSLQNNPSPAADQAIATLLTALSTSIVQ